MMVVGVLQEFILNFPMQGETIMSKFGKYILNTKLKWGRATPTAVPATCPCVL